MLKRYIVLFILLLTFASAQAQTDTLLFYLNNAGQVVDKAQADHYTVIAPPNANAVHPVYEFYMNGARKMVATSYTGSPSYLLHGTAMHYFPNGKRKAIVTYRTGATVSEINYYPNGKVYTTVSYDSGAKLHQTCNDSTGTALTIDGNGKWLTYNDDLTQMTGSGQVVKGKPEGEWHETIGDSINSTIVYHKGVIRSGVSVDRKGKSYTFKQKWVRPTSNQANIELSSGLRIYIKDHPQPPFDMPRNLVSFWVNADGSISDLTALSNNDSALTQWAIKAVTRSKWTPGTQNGVPVRMLSYYPSDDNAGGLMIREVRGEVRGVSGISPALPPPGSNIQQLPAGVRVRQ